jgi:tetratricopeptide (TPR) repeat protein
MNQQHRSLDYWNRILDQDPRNKVILTRAGDAYRNLNEYDMSVDYYRRALNIEFDTYAVLGLAVVSKVQGKYDESIESLRRLVQQDPKNYRFYVELADCWARKGERAKAINVLGDFQKQGLRNPVVIEMMDKLKA